MTGERLRESMDFSILDDATNVRTSFNEKSNLFYYEIVHKNGEITRGSVPAVIDGAINPEVDAFIDELDRRTAKKDNTPVAEEPAKEEVKEETPEVVEVPAEEEVIEETPTKEETTAEEINLEDRRAGIKALVQDIVSCYDINTKDISVENQGAILRKYEALCGSQAKVAEYIHDYITARHERVVKNEKMCEKRIENMLRLKSEMPYDKICRAIYSSKSMKEDIPEEVLAATYNKVLARVQEENRAIDTERIISSNKVSTDEMLEIFNASDKKEEVETFTNPDGEVNEVPVTTTNPQRKYVPYSSKIADLGRMTSRLAEEDLSYGELQRELQKLSNQTGVDLETVRKMYEKAELNAEKEEVETVIKKKLTGRKLTSWNSEKMKLNKNSAFTPETIAEEAKSVVVPELYEAFVEDLIKNQPRFVAYFYALNVMRMANNGTSAREIRHYIDHEVHNPDQNAETIIKVVEQYSPYGQEIASKCRKYFMKAPERLKAFVLDRFASFKIKDEYTEKKPDVSEEIDRLAKIREEINRLTRETEEPQVFFEEENIQRGRR